MLSLRGGAVLRKLIATIGILFDVSAALVITLPVIVEPQAQRDRKAEALAYAENPVVTWRGNTDERMAAAAHHRTLFGAERRRAIISTFLVLAGVACSSLALWLP